jgi:hypothetical protein
MTVLKKKNRCNRCGLSMPAGSKVHFKKSYRRILDSRGFLQCEKLEWLPMHTAIAECWQDQ